MLNSITDDNKLLFTYVTLLNATLSHKNVLFGNRKNEFSFHTFCGHFHSSSSRSFLDALFSWSRAVQIRTNLDLVLDWLQGAGLGDIASEFMKKLSATVNFLCTPKTRLIQVIHLHWQQVLRVLGQEYQILSFIVVSSSSHPGAVYRRIMCC